MEIRALKGFKDILPGEVEQWQWVEERARGLFHRFGFTEIRMPVLEKTELFCRSIGETSDIVEKEMYTFEDRNGDLVTLRPEGTASVIRALVEHTLHAANPVTRLYTMGPMFRHERPQKGRLRQFHQLSVEAIGSGNPAIDVEVMAMAWQLLLELKIPVALEINSLGCHGCRQGFRHELVSFLDPLAEDLCPDCRRRKDTNPLRVLDCKSENCRQHVKDAPAIIDYLCNGCREHFALVKKRLDLLHIPYLVNPFMVRGLDYYCRTTFELVTGELGSQSAVGAGGRYDGLIGQLGGPDLPGIGFAIGMERLILLLEKGKREIPQRKVDLFCLALGREAEERVFPLVHFLRAKGVMAVLDFEGRSLKAQLKLADRLRASYVYILGERELQEGVGQLRNMATGIQVPVSVHADTAQWGELVLSNINKNDK